MPRSLLNDALRPVTFSSGGEQRSYLVKRREDVWFITFDGEEFGPYKSEGEALLFAVDAAHKLGEHGTQARVLRADETGDASPVWTYGIDSYPPAGRPRP